MTMADIKQAAKWMMEGKRVRRKSWKNEFSYVSAKKNGCTINEYQAVNRFDVEDLLADDWGISE